MKKHGVLALVLAGVMLLLCGCGGMTTDDAKDYVQFALDCGYKAEVKKYAEITETTEKEAKKEYETNLDTIMKEAGFDDTGVSDELKADYRSMFEKMLKSANYKVKEAKETEDDEFTVTVEVCPFTAFSTVSDELDQWVTDTYSNVETIPSDVTPNYSIYNQEDGTFTSDLDQAKYDKQEENKKLFAEYLATHPLTWVDGKEYGITQEDQSEISLNLNQYQVALAAEVENPTLEWHARHEECVPWSLEQLSALSLAISNVVYPKYHLMQEYKTQIFEADSIDKLKAIELNYEDTDSE